MRTDWIVHDKGINLYLENQDEGIRLIVHPWMATEKAERIATDLNSHAALVEAAQLMLDRWERGDLAEAVRALSAALAAAKGTK